MGNQLRLDVAQLTDVGRKREHNEDNMAYVIPKDPQVMTRKGALFIVADGMGGHAAGEVASEIAVDTVSNVYYQDDSEDVPESLLHAIRRANAAIHQRAAENMLRSGMGTTCVAAVLRGNRAYIANVGDSRAYVVRNTAVRQVSQDHSWVAEQVRAGLLTEEQARTHAQRNVITRCLGTQAEVEIDVFAEDLEEGDSLVLCTDGLSGLVSDEELRRIVDEYVPQESVYHLVERANENGGPDNITAIVVRVQEVGVEPPGVRHPVRVGGRILDSRSAEGEDTKTLELVPGSSGGAINRVPVTAPLRVASGPLASPESTLGSQPFTQILSPTDKEPLLRRNRLFYPSLALLVLIVVALVGGGIYYFIHKSQDVEQVLAEAQNSINAVKAEVTSNPGVALSQLALVQDNLRKVQKNHQLSTAQNQHVTALLAALTTEVRTAIDTYNGSPNAQIKVLPCDGTKPNIINQGITSTPASIASVQMGKTTRLYALGQDNNIYMLSQGPDHFSLLSALPQSTPPHVQFISGAGGLLFTLQAQADPKNPFSINLYRPDASGNLKAAGAVQLANTFTQNGNTPNLLTASDTNLYVVLASKSAPYNALLLNYSITNGQVSPNPAQQAISGNITGIAALPHNQLFLLIDGSIKSLQFARDSQPVPVLTQPMAPPLATSDSPFTANMEVPAPQKQNPSQFLAVAGATSLSAGIVKNVPHLYISDPTNHRIIDLTVVPGASPAVIPSTATPGVGTNRTVIGSPTASNATAAPTATNVTLQLFQQIVSATSFSQLKSVNQVKSVAFDPQAMFVYVLIQNPSSQSNAPSFSIISLSTDMQSHCTTQSSGP